MGTTKVVSVDLSSMYDRSNYILFANAAARRDGL